MPRLSVLLLSIAVLAVPAPGAGQVARSSWTVAVGGGGGVGLGGHDLSRRGSATGVATVAVEHRVNGFSVGLEWTGAWLRGAPGGDSRHLVGPVVSLPFSGALSRASGALRLGIGVGTATVADVDRAPKGPPYGDTVVGIGDTAVFGATAGLSARLGISRDVGLEPVLRVVGMHSGNHTLGVAALVLRLSLGLS